VVKTYTKEEFDQLPTDPFPTVDWSEVEKKHSNPYRWWTGSFKAPFDMDGRALEKLTQIAWGKFERAMLLQGWHHRGKPVLTGPYEYRELETPLVNPLYKEYRFSSIFAKVPKKVRIEIG